MSTVSFPEYGPESPTREKSSRSRRSRLHSTFGTIKDYMTPRQVTMAAHAARSSTYVHSGDTVRAFFAAIDTNESDSVPVEMLRAALEQRGMSAAALEAFFDACPRQADDAMTLDEFLVGKRLPGMVELFSSVSMLPPGWSEVLEAGPGGSVYYWIPRGVRCVVANNCWHKRTWSLPQSLSPWHMQPDCRPLRAAGLSRDRARETSQIRRGAAT